MKTGERLLGSTAGFPFERRIFNMAVLAGIVLTAFGTAMDVYYSGSVWMDMAFLGFWTATYCISRFGHAYRTVSVIAFAVFEFVFIPYLWMTSGGMHGAIPFYIILFTVIVAMILREKLRFVMSASLIAVTLLLICNQIYTEQIPWGFLLNTPIHLFMILAASALLMTQYSNAYSKEKQRSEDYAKAIEANIRQQQYYTENLEQLIGRLRSERHDFNNHLSVIHGLLESGETGKAKAYAAQLVKDAAEYHSIVSVPYPALRALLNHKLSAARDAGIELKLDVSLPEGLLLNEFDLAAILGNLLDNAMEACAKLGDTAPYISLTLKYQPDYLVIRIANPFLLAPEGKNHTSKADQENHGFGLKNVTYLVGRHNGLMEIKKEGGVFEVDIALLVE